MNDLGLGGLLGLLEGGALALQGGLVVGDLRLHILEVALGAAVSVERVGRRAGDRGGELVGHRLVGRRLGSLEQRQRSGARRHEAVDGDLVDRALQGVDLRLQLGLLAVEFVGFVAQAIELGLGVRHRGRGGVGIVASGLDLGGRAWAAASSLPSARTVASSGSAAAPTTSTRPASAARTARRPTIAVSIVDVSIL